MTLYRVMELIPSSFASSLRLMFVANFFFFIVQTSYRLYNIYAKKSIGKHRKRPEENVIFIT